MHTTIILPPHLALALALALALVAGCTVDAGDSGNPFQTSAPPPNTMNSSNGTGDTEGSGGSGGSGSSEAGGSSGPVDGDTTASITTGPMGSTTNTSLGDSTTGGGGGNGMQPLMGMYSHCDQAADCGFSPALCMTITDAGGTPIDGFCTEADCVNPAVDCDPSPVVTAPATCSSLGGDIVCALDCTGGAACPIGMTCYDFGPGVGQICG